MDVFLALLFIGILTTMPLLSGPTLLIVIVIVVSMKSLGRDVLAGLPWPFRRGRPPGGN